jgi:xanthine/uracil permease
MASNGQDGGGVSPKVTGATLGGALATVLWILLAAFVDPVKENLDENALLALTGATGTIFAFILGYWMRDPVRDAGWRALRERV